MILTQELLGDGVNHSIFLPHFLLHLAYGGSMLPRAVPRGDAPKGVRLERHPDVEVPKFVEPSHYGESVGSTGFNVSFCCAPKKWLSQNVDLYMI